jgi:hypothetical protein
MDPVREATGRTRERLAPHAAQAKDAAYHYAGAARDRAVVTTRERVVPALVHAKESATPRVEHAVEVARQRVRHDVVPRVQFAVDQAREAAEPVRDEARLRAGAALSAIRGDLTAADVAKITRRKKRKARRRKLLVIAVLAGGGYAVWTWWQRRDAEPEWLTDEPDTELRGESSTSAGLEREPKPAEDEFRSSSPRRSPETD